MNVEAKRSRPRVVAAIHRQNILSKYSAWRTCEEASNGTA
jgi:hypothetical protein